MLKSKFNRKSVESQSPCLKYKIMNIPNFHFALRDDLESLCVAENLKSGGALSLSPSDFVPHRAEPMATGYDVRCAVEGGMALKPGCYFKIPLGFRMYAPSGWWLSCAPRSSTFIKKHIHALYGIIDETFESQCMFIGQYIPDACCLLKQGGEIQISFGERIAQLVPVPRQEMSVNIRTNYELDKMYSERNAIRAEGGFGSSGNF